MKKRFKITLLIVLIFLVILIAYLKVIPIKLSLESKTLLTDFFELGENKTSVDVSDLVNDPKLAELYNLKFNSLLEFNKKEENKNIDVNINGIKRKNLNSYIVKFDVEREFNYKGLDNKSWAQDFYICEIQKVNDKIYISKLIDGVDYNSYLDSKISNSVIRELIKYFLPFSEYSSYLNNELESRKDFELNKK
ncbi:Uncharacterised protein [Clostridium perfringens]|uniref:Uncharacterized protein n=1 Tax=Clostridium perfringens TaxID=1502 RepID=A0A2X3ACS3_CLOPF|nr:hypothetical protein [Clostridium perfringens]AXH51109.1 hypothetical protein C8114_00250 [Clostridium perfringens]MBI6068705.1 hypothetical protein [Clostridium perfringens]MBI6097278.1 hypothetical protein [Clostridium perfringens]SQB60030.1 Uncharacterised protein [Clostridium perfringens]